VDLWGIVGPFHSSLHEMESQSEFEASTQGSFSPGSGDGHKDGNREEAGDQLSYCDTHMREGHELIRF
jgi:hypothetical protein